MAESGAEDSPSIRERLFPRALISCLVLVLLGFGSCGLGAWYLQWQEGRARDADRVAFEAALLNALRTPPKFKSSDPDAQVDLLVRGSLGGLNVIVFKRGWDAFVAAAGPRVVEVRLGARSAAPNPRRGTVWRATLRNQEGQARQVELVFEHHDLSIARWLVLVDTQPCEDELETR